MLEKKEKLTLKQRDVLECLEWFINNNGYSPTYRELAVELNCSLHSVFKRMTILIDKGYVTCINGKIRTLRVIKKYD